jgi:hypothetical protein
MREATCPSGTGVTRPIPRSDPATRPTQRPLLTKGPPPTPPHRKLSTRRDGRPGAREAVLLPEARRSANAGNGLPGARSCDLAVHRGATDGEQFSQLSDRVFSCAWSLSRTVRWVGLSLSALPLSRPLASPVMCFLAWYSWGRGSFARERLTRSASELVAAFQAQPRLQSCVLRPVSGDGVTCRRHASSRGCDLGHVVGLRRDRGSAADVAALCPRLRDHQVRSPTAARLARNAESSCSFRVAATGLVMRRAERRTTACRRRRRSRRLRRDSGGRGPVRRG